MFIYVDCGLYGLYVNGLSVCDKKQSQHIPKEQSQQSERQHTLPHQKQ